jgi:predicted ATPase
MWEFDVEATKQETTIVENIADVNFEKIQHLPSEVHETLKIASLLGFPFEEDIIAWASTTK